MRKIFILMLGILFLFSFAFVSASLPTVKQGECTELKTILNSTAVNLSSITYTNETTIYLDTPMTQNGKTFNYTFCDTTVLGTYLYDYYDDAGNVYVNDFEVTPSGRNGAANIVFFLLIYILLYGLTLFLFFKRDLDLAPFIIFSGSILGFLGVYTVQNGIIIFRDYFTNILSYVSIVFGFGLGLWSLVEWLREQV